MVRGLSRAGSRGRDAAELRRRCGIDTIDLSRAAWRKSTRSSGQGGQCVEVAANLAGIVAVRDSKNPRGPRLTFTPAQWGAFLAAVRRGEYG